GDGLADTVALNGNNTYTGGTGLGTSNLTVAVGNPNALGTGTFSIDAGELLATTTETIANKLDMTPGFTIAAAHGQTLTPGTGGWTLTPIPGQAVTFGAPGQDGTVIFKSGAGVVQVKPGAYGVAVQAGTLKGGDGGLYTLVAGASSVAVQAGATL